MSMSSVTEFVGRRTHHRIHALDAVRGLALCGILVCNLPDIAILSRLDANDEWLPTPLALELVARQRFFPIFAFLFGLSFALFLDSAAERTTRPKLVMTRRLIALGLLGFIPYTSALPVYAILGLVLVLPATWLPRWLVLVLAAAALIAKPDGTSANIGILLLGYAAGRFGIARTLDRRTGQTAAVLAVSLVGAAFAIPWQLSELDESGFSASSGVAGLLLAAAYVTGFLLLLRTPLGRPMSAVFEPLGRMALTNYVSAALLGMVAVPVLGLHDSTRFGLMFLLASGILATQLLFGVWWLRRFRYGPLEWCWRCVTWWEIVPNRGITAR